MQYEILDWILEINYTKYVISEDLLYSIVSIANNTLLYT